VHHISIPPAIQNWLAALSPVRSREIRAWINNSWKLVEGFPEPATWAPPEVELTAFGLADADVYRLLLARSGYGGRKVVHMSRGELRRFRQSRGHLGFQDVVDLLNASSLERRRRA
jgi:hypothetical protein